MKTPARQHHCLDRHISLFPIDEVRHLRDREVHVHFNSKAWEKAMFHLRSPEGVSRTRVAVTVEFQHAPNPQLWEHRVDSPQVPKSGTNEQGPIYLTPEGLAEVRAGHTAEKCVLWARLSQ